MSKNKSVTELRDELRQLDARAKAIMDGYEAEKRMPNSTEEEELGKIRSQRFRLNAEIDDAEALARRSGTAYQKDEFSLARAIRSMVAGQKMSGIEAEVCGEARNNHERSGANLDSNGIWVPAMMERRATMTAATEAVTGVVIDEQQQEMLFPLLPNLTLAPLGVRMLTGLRGNLMWPNYTDPTVFWEGENTPAKQTEGTYAKGKVYKPIRIAAYVDISDQLLIQENRSTEADLRNRIAAMLAQKLEATAFAKEKASDEAPEGIFSILDSTVSGEMSWANVVKFEELADIDNALLGNLGYVMHKSLLYKAKTKVKDASGAGGFIFGGDGSNYLNGYKALRSGHIPSGLGDGADEFGMVFGNWNDFFIGQWGSFNIKIDPYTQALNGVTRLIVSGYFNMGAIRPKSFVVGSLK